MIRAPARGLIVTLPRIIILPHCLLVAALAIAPAAAAPLVVYAAGDIAECRGRPATDSDAARTAKLVPAGSNGARSRRHCVSVRDSGNSAVLLRADLGRAPRDDTRGARQSRLPWAAVDDFRRLLRNRRRGQGYFATRLGDWLVIGLDSQLIGESLDREYQWLATTLRETSDVRCTLALWHMPAFSSGLEHGPTREDAAVLGAAGGAGGPNSC